MIAAAKFLVVFAGSAVVFAFAVLCGADVVRFVVRILHRMFEED